MTFCRYKQLFNVIVTPFESSNLRIFESSGSDLAELDKSVVAASCENMTVAFEEFRESIKKFTFVDDETDEILSIAIQEVVHPQFGLFTWPCAPVLAQYILKNKKKIKDQNILEIGAGTALPGITAAKCGGNVILSDAEHYQKSLSNTRKCCSVNAIGEECIKVVPLTWGELSSNILELPKIDIILGSDCFYQPKDFESVIVTVAYLIEQNPNCVFWTTYQLRSSSWSIKLEYLLDKWSLLCSNIPLSSFGGDADNLGGHCMSEKHTIQMYEIKRRI